jgi:hypothetical protein
MAMHHRVGMWMALLAMGNDTKPFAYLPGTPSASFWEAYGADEAVAAVREMQQRSVALRLMSQKTIDSSKRSVQGSLASKVKKEKKEKEKGKKAKSTPGDSGAVMEMMVGAVNDLNKRFQKMEESMQKMSKKKKQPEEEQEMEESEDLSSEDSGQ